MRGARSSPWKLVIGSVVASAVVLGALVAGSGNSGCASQQTQAPPDAAPTPCEAGPHVFCAVATPDQASCNTDVGDSKWLKDLTPATRYPLGCIINFVGERDNEGDCKLDAVCKCETSEVTTVIGGTDAGAGDSGADAAPTTTTTTTTTAPAWNCFP